ncbi:MAG TPA: hypothetical protein VML96_13805 [Egibacteraceae bacterium]|nr:hypothetical protein [Egibacteraceae bacterium]
MMGSDVATASSSQSLLVAGLKRAAEIQIDVRVILTMLVAALWLSSFAIATSEPRAAVLLPLPDDAQMQLP